MVKAGFREAQQQQRAWESSSMKRHRERQARREHEQAQREREQEAKPLKPLTPSPNKNHVYTLPSGWARPFSVVLEAAVKSGDAVFAAFPTFFLSAADGNKDALWKVLESSTIVHQAAKKHWQTMTHEDRVSCNALLYCANLLAERALVDSDEPTADSKSQTKETK